MATNEKRMCLNVLCNYISDLGMVQHGYMKLLMKGKGWGMPLTTLC